MIPALTDFTLMEEKKAKLFVNSPNTIEGNEISKCDTSAAEYQAKEAGLVDFKGSEEDVLAQIRALVTMLPADAYLRNRPDRLQVHLSSLRNHTVLQFSLHASHQQFRSVR